MKKLIAALVLGLCVSITTLAGDIPGSGPTPPPTCTENCLRAQEETLSAEPILPTADLPVSITEIVTGIFALVF